MKLFEKVLKREAKTATRDPEEKRKAWQIDQQLTTRRPW
jgi:hypothetical protein